MCEKRNPHGLPWCGNSCSPLQQNPAFVAIDYHMPTSSSGVGDLPGEQFHGHPRPMGRVERSRHHVQSGRNDLSRARTQPESWHGGLPAIFGQKKVGNEAPGSATFVEPQCKPNHQTTMSYMFQGHGLILPTGDAVLDYSDQLLGNLDETSLVDAKFSPIPKYRPTWFAPADSTLATTTLGVQRQPGSATA